MTGMSGIWRCAVRPSALLLAVAGMLATAPMALAAQLLMLEQPGCPWCALFNEQIAPAWPNTPEGRRAPLRRVDITEPWPDDLDTIRRDVVTPTFILVDNGEEVARIRGYPGDEFFWFRIDEMLKELPEDAPAN